MLSPTEYISLESACSSLKVRSPAALEAFSAQVLGILDSSSQFNPSTICVVDNGKPNPGIPLTYQDIGEYLLKASSSNHVPVFLHAQSGTVESSRVFVSRSWISRNLAAAAEKLKTSEVVERPASNQAGSVTRMANAGAGSAIWVEQPAPMSTDGLRQLRQMLEHQNDRRKVNEKASKVTIQLLEVTARAEKAETIIAARDAEIEVLLNRDRLSVMEVSTLQRQLQTLRLEISDLKQRQQQPTQSTNVQRRNKGVREAKLAAQALAAELWITDEFRSHTVGRMADEIIGRMSYGPHADRMPETAGTVTDWLNEGTVPAGARKPGRPKKKK